MEVTWHGETVTWHDEIVTWHADEPGPEPGERLTYALQAGDGIYIWQTEKQ